MRSRYSILPDHLPTAFGGLAEFHPGAHGADPSRDEAAIIQVSTRETTGDEVRQLLHKAADGPSGLTPSAREQLKSRLQAGDDPTTIAQWLMTVRREPGRMGSSDSGPGG